MSESEKTLDSHDMFKDLPFKIEIVEHPPPTPIEIVYVEHEIEPIVFEEVFPFEIEYIEQEQVQLIEPIKLKILEHATVT